MGNLKNNIENQGEKLKKIEEEINSLKGIRNQIFSVMALFFGIFAFISIDIGVTKSLLSYFSVVDNNIINFNFNSHLLLYIIIFSLVSLQIIFFVCINTYLLKPFLNKIDINLPIKNKAFDYALGFFIVFFAFVFITITYLFYENSYLKNKVKSLEQNMQINTFNNKNK